MITSKLKAALFASGCTLVLYESDTLSTIITDQITQTDIVGLIIQPNSITFEIKGNGVNEHYPPIVVEIFKQVRPEDTAEHNETILTETIEIAKNFIVKLIESGDFKKITSFQAQKIKESRYDANVLGWSLPLDLYYLENKDNC